MFDYIYYYIMKSFTNLKTIDEIMYIVDGIKGTGGLGYKPYTMTGGMAFRDIENPDNLLYEQEIEPWEEAKGEEAKAQAQEFETLKSFPLDDVLPTLTDERIVFELRSLNDLMAQSKREGIKEADELYKNIVIDYNKIIEEVGRRPYIQQYAKYEQGDIDKEIEDKNIKGYTEEEQKDAMEKIAFTEFENSQKVFKDALDKNNIKMIEYFNSPKYREILKEKVIKKQKNKLDEMTKSNNDYVDEFEKIKQRCDVAKTIKYMKNEFDIIKNADMTDETSKGAKAVSDYSKINPLMNSIFNDVSTSAEEATNEIIDDVIEKENFYNEFVNVKKYPFDKFILKTKEEQMKILKNAIAGSLSGAKGEAVITSNPILLALIDKDTSDAKSSGLLSAYNDVFISALADLGFTNEFIEENILKYSNFDIVKDDTVWEIKSFYKDSYTTEEGVQGYSQAKFYGGGTILTTPSEGTMEIKVKGKKKNLIVPAGSTIKIDYKINRLHDGKVNFNVDIIYGPNKQVIQLLPKNKYNYYILEFNKDVIQYFDIGKKYNWDTYIEPNKDKKKIKIPNSAFIKLPNLYAEIFSNIFLEENQLKTWMEYKNTYPEKDDIPEISTKKEEPKKEGPKKKKKGKNKGKGIYGGTITNEIQIYNKIDKYIDDDNSSKLRDLKNDIENKIIHIAKNDTDDDNASTDIKKYHDIIDEKITPALSNMYMEKEKIIEHKHKGKLLKGGFEALKESKKYDLGSYDIDGDELPRNKMRGYLLFNKLKKKFNIEMPNGLAFEELEKISEEIKNPLQKFTNDYSDIKSVGEYIKEIFIKNDDDELYYEKQRYKKFIDNLEKENKIDGDFIYQLNNKIKNSKSDNVKNQIYEYDKIIDTLIDLYGSDNDTYLYPWDTSPYDLYNDNNLIENKNYIYTNASYGGETIDDKSYNIIQNMKNKGKTRDEIDEYFSDNGLEMPTIKITKGKLTGKNINGNDNLYTLIFKEKNGNKYVDKLLYDGNEKIKYKNNPKFVYDMLTNNARVIYSPLDDNKAIIKNGRLKLNDYTIDGQYYNVPYSALHIEKISKKILK